jgi:hypothetical protein
MTTLTFRKAPRTVIAGRRTRDDQDSESDALPLYEDRRIRDVLL